MTVETIENKRKRMIFRSCYRGTKEMDLVMGSFADQNISGFSEDELEQYESVLQENDIDLYNWISGKEDPPSNVISDVFKKLMAHKFL